MSADVVQVVDERSTSTTLAPLGSRAPGHPLAQLSVRRFGMPAGSWRTLDW